MEFDQHDKGGNSEFVAWAKQRMREMNEKAEIVTKEMGLPPEGKYGILSALYGPRQLTEVEQPTALADRPVKTKGQD